MTTTHEQEGSVGDQPFQVETHGIDFIPPSERWATPRNIGAMWAGTSLNVEYFIYGALLIGFGFSFKTTLLLIVLGNLSYFLLAMASLQGPQTGTTAFTISRAPFGTRGARVVSFFNWITQLGFETEGLILVVGAFEVISHMLGIHVSSPVKVVFVIAAAAIQAVLPYLGHATMVKVLRALIVPFALIFLAFAYFDLRHGVGSFSGSPYANWELFTAGLAFSIALSGLGWTECGNDYTRYIPHTASKKSIVGWLFVSTAIPQIVLMSLGAATFTFMSSGHEFSLWNGANPFEALYQQHVIPHWFIAIFMVFAVFQLFGINSMDLYSSGVSIQALGVKLKRYQAVVLDSVLAGALTMWAEFQGTFSLYMKEFVGVIIVWIAPWFAIFMVDWFLRRCRYSASDLQRDDHGSLYWVGTFGVSWSALFSFALGLVASLVAFSKAPPPVNFPFHWMTPISNHFGASCAGDLTQGVCTAGWYGGADFSIATGIIVAGLTYFLAELATGRIKKQTAQLS